MFRPNCQLEYVCNSEVNVLVVHVGRITVIPVDKTPVVAYINLEVVHEYGCETDSELYIELLR